MDMKDPSLQVRAKSNWLRRLEQDPGTLSAQRLLLATIRGLSAGSSVTVQTLRVTPSREGEGRASPPISKSGNRGNDRDFHQQLRGCHLCLHAGPGWRFAFRHPVIP